MVCDATGGGTYCSLRSSERSWEKGEHFRLKWAFQGFQGPCPNVKVFLCYWDLCIDGTFERASRVIERYLTSSDIQP